jgi:hypothetical protein
MFDGAEPKAEAPPRRTSVLEIIGGGAALLSVMAALFYVLRQRDYKPIEPAGAPIEAPEPGRDRPRPAADPALALAVPSGAPAAGALARAAGGAWQPVPLPEAARSSGGDATESSASKLKKCCAFLHAEERKTGAKEKAAYQRAAASCDKARAMISSDESDHPMDLAGPVLSAFEDALQQAHLPSCESAP